MYVKRHRLWHFVLSFDQPRPIEDADVASFRALSETFAVDARRVYWNGRPVEGADPGSFVALSSFVGNDATEVFLQNSAFSCEQPLHVPSFEHLGGSYFRDRDHTYCIWYAYDAYDCDPVDCDVQSFRVLDETFAIDSAHVFNHGRIEALDAASFVRISDYFARDVSDVYFLRFGGKNTEQVTVEPLQADPASFRLLDDRYARDATSVFFYYNCHSLARQRHLWIECSRVDVDADSFRPIERARFGEHPFPDATDGGSLFLHGRRLPLDASDFQLRESDEGVFVESVDLDAVYALVAEAGDATELGPIRPPPDVETPDRILDVVDSSPSDASTSDDEDIPF